MAACSRRRGAARSSYLPTPGRGGRAARRPAAWRAGARVGASWPASTSPSAIPAGVAERLTGRHERAGALAMAGRADRGRTPTTPTTASRSPPEMNRALGRHRARSGAGPRIWPLPDIPVAARARHGGTTRPSAGSPIRARRAPRRSGSSPMPARSAARCCWDCRRCSGCGGDRASPARSRSGPSRPAWPRRDAPVVLAEIYPSLFVPPSPGTDDGRDPRRGAGPHRSRERLRALDARRRRSRRCSPGPRTGGRRARDASSAEEAWILGLGCRGPCRRAR